MYTPIYMSHGVRGGRPDDSDRDGGPPQDWSHRARGAAKTTVTGTGGRCQKGVARTGGCQDESDPSARAIPRESFREIPFHESPSARAHQREPIL